MSSPNSKSILVLSPHPDDSELGAGGTINRLSREGNEISIVAFSPCEQSLPPDDSDRLTTEFEDAMELVQPASHRLLDYPVRRFSEHRQSILEEMIDIRDTVSPDLVIGPSVDDVHQDHEVIANEMIRAFKTSAEIISYELPWNHISFNTELFYSLDSSDIDQKLAFLSQYQSQADTHDRSYFSEEFIRGLASVRGVQCDTPYAEAFDVIRWMP